ncbi:MAG: hypothetical protein ACREHD_17645 [Pirellulales bacterium]
MAILITHLEFNAPPPGREELHQRLEQRCGLAIASRDAEVVGLRYDDFWLLELPQAKVSMGVRRQCNVDPPAQMFRELGWPPPPPAPQQWGVSINGDLTMQFALADVLREAGGKVKGDGGSRFSGALDIFELRKRFADHRRQAWLWIIPSVLYCSLVALLIPIWFPITLGYATARNRRPIRRWLWLRRNRVDRHQAADARCFARCVLARIGGSGGKIGAASRLFGSKVRCRMPAAMWAARQEVGPWGSAAEVVDGLCHTDSGTPWYIQFADRPPEPLRDWLNREMRAPGGQ